VKRTVPALILIVAMVIVSGSGFSQSRRGGARAKDRAKDPVCGLTVDKIPSLSVSYNG